MNKMSRIRYLILDVDGTMTDGHIYISPQGEIMKAFHVRDGYGIHSMLPLMGIEPVIITGRNNEIVAKRAAELSIKYVFQNVSDKVAVMNDFLAEQNKKHNQNAGYAECAYMGDDIPDLKCMKLIAENGGIAACPADAVEQVKKISGFVSHYDGGNGAVRELIDWLYLNSQCDD